MLMCTERMGVSCSGESGGPRKAGATELMALGDSYSENYSSFHSHSRLEVRSVQGKKVEPHLEPCPYPFLSWMQISIPYC